MPYIKDYLEWRGDLSFSKDDINDVDILALSLVPLLDLDGLAPTIDSNESISLHDLFTKYLEPKYNKSIHLGLIISDEYTKSIISYKDHNRYKHLKLSDYFNEISSEESMQCCGCTIEIRKDLHLICCSGTDDTIIGWKENLLMMYNSITNGEIRIHKYIESIIDKYEGNFIVAGHSKGGIFSEVGTALLDDERFNRVTKVLAFDSPGIQDLSYYDEKVLNRIKEMTLYIPDTSIVGRSFNHIEKQIVVKSTNNGLYQHDPFSWKVLGREFVTVAKCSKMSDDMSELINKVVRNMSIDERKNFVSTITNLFTDNNINRLLEVDSNKLAILRSFNSLNRQDKRFLTKILIQLERNSAFRKIIFYFIIDNNKEQRKQKLKVKQK